VPRAGRGIVIQRPPGAHKQLFIGGETSVRRTLLLRASLVLGLFLTVIAIFVLDRDGLVDNVDHDVSLTDVIYFSIITVTTVGYGDIVPVTQQARLVDALLVTPIRLFIWLVFLGTAYQFVIQRIIEEFRMRAMQSRLQDHVVICGFGHAGRCAAAELVLRGTPARQILIVDTEQANLEEAAELGYVGLLGDATREEVLKNAMVDTARAALVATGRDDSTVLTVLTLRSLCPGVRIVASVREMENDKLVRQSGANATVLPARLGGVLMADSVATSALAGYVSDLISAEGRVMLVEREAGPAEIDRTPHELEGALLVRIHRRDRMIGFWEADARVQAGDVLVLIEPQSRSS
jgi:voltage-gated potassium channel